MHVTANAGFVSVGITSDTAEFAVASNPLLARQRMGRQRYPQARELTITADCGGSNGARVRLWKLELQKTRRRDQAWRSTSTTIRRHIEVEQIEHRLFCPHHAELAWPTAHGSSCRGRVDRRNHQQRRAQGRKRARHALLCKGHQSQRCRDEASRHHRRSSPILNGTTIKPRPP